MCMARLMNESHNVEVCYRDIAHYLFTLKQELVEQCKLTL